MKSFSDWHKQKSTIHRKHMSDVYFREREVWWCAIGCNVGFEENGKGDYFSRPVLVMKKFNRHVFWGIPLSTTDKTGNYYHPLSVVPGAQSKALLSQIRLFDAKRLLDKMGTANIKEFEQIKKAVKQFL